MLDITHRKYPFTSCAYITKHIINFLWPVMFPLEYLTRNVSNRTAACKYLKCLVNIKRWSINFTWF